MIDSKLDSLIETADMLRKDLHIFSLRAKEMRSKENDYRCAAESAEKAEKETQAKFDQVMLEFRKIMAGRESEVEVLSPSEPEEQLGREG